MQIRGAVLRQHVGQFGFGVNSEVSVSVVRLVPKQKIGRLLVLEGSISLTMQLMALAIVNHFFTLLTTLGNSVKI